MHRNKGAHATQHTKVFHIRRREDVSGSSSIISTGGFLVGRIRVHSRLMNCTMPLVICMLLCRISEI